MYQNSLFFVLLASFGIVYCVVISSTDAGRLLNDAQETRSALTVIGVSMTLLITWLTVPDVREAITVVFVAFVLTGSPFVFRSLHYFVKRLRRENLHEGMKSYATKSLEDLAAQSRQRAD